MKRKNKQANRQHDVPDAVAAYARDVAAGIEALGQLLETMRAAIPEAKSNLRAAAATYEKALGIHEDLKTQARLIENNMFTEVDRIIHLSPYQDPEALKVIRAALETVRDKYLVD